MFLEFRLRVLELFEDDSLAWLPNHLIPVDNSCVQSVRTYLLRGRE